MTKCHSRSTPSLPSRSLPPSASAPHACGQLNTSTTAPIGPRPSQDKKLCLCLGTVFFGWLGPSRSGLSQPATHRLRVVVVATSKPPQVIACLVACGRVSRRLDFVLTGREPIRPLASRSRSGRPVTSRPACFARAGVIIITCISAAGGLPTLLHPRRPSASNPRAAAAIDT
jgi:hypothetical protein